MKLLTTDEFCIKQLAQLAIDSGLYESPAWTLISCLQDITFDEDVAVSSDLIIIQDDTGNNIGVVFHNEEYRWSYFDTNIQIYIKPDFRGMGYGKKLYTEMNKRLIKSNFSGMLSAGYGIAGSMSFWGKMSDLHSVNASCFLPLESTY